MFTFVSLMDPVFVDVAGQKAWPLRVSTELGKRDMCEEVIDPSFDFDAPEDL